MQTFFFLSFNNHIKAKPCKLSTVQLKGCVYLILGKIFKIDFTMNASFYLHIILMVLFQIQIVYDEYLKLVNLKY